MAEAGDMSDTAQPGQGGRRAADVGDGVLASTAGAEQGGGRPQPQCQFWVGRRTAVRIGQGQSGARQGRLIKGTSSCLLLPTHPWERQPCSTLSYMPSWMVAISEKQQGKAYLPSGCPWAAGPGPWKPGHGHP